MLQIKNKGGRCNLLLSDLLRKGFEQKILLFMDGKNVRSKVVILARSEEIILILTKKENRRGGGRLDEGEVVKVGQCSCLPQMVKLARIKQKVMAYFLPV